MSHPALQKPCMTIHLSIKGVPLLYNVLDKYGIYQFGDFLLNFTNSAKKAHFTKIRSGGLKSNPYYIVHVFLLRALCRMLRIFSVKIKQ